LSVSDDKCRHINSNRAAINPRQSCSLDVSFPFSWRVARRVGRTRVNGRRRAFYGSLDRRALSIRTTAVSSAKRQRPRCKSRCEIADCKPNPADRLSLSLSLFLARAFRALQRGMATYDVIRACYLRDIENRISYVRAQSGHSWHGNIIITYRITRKDARECIAG